MNVKVLHKFRDKHTGEIYRRGDVITITEERFNEIKRVGQLVYKIPDVPAQFPSEACAVNTSNDAEKAVKTAPAASSDGFDAMTVKELREYADKAYKLTFGGGTKKAEMIETLRKMEQANR